MRLRALDVALAAWLAALYAGIVVALPALSFYVVQVRVADALLPLAMLLGRPAIVGLTLGCFIANFFGFSFPFNLVDATLGSMANFLACTLAYRRARRPGGLKPRSAFITTCLMTLVITFIVGTYLPFILVALGLPAYLPFIPIGPIPPIVALVLSGWGGVGLGTFLAVSVLGYLLFSALRRVLTKGAPHALSKYSFSSQAVMVRAASGPASSKKRW